MNNIRYFQNKLVIIILQEWFLEYLLHLSFFIDDLCSMEPSMDFVLRKC